MSFKPSYKKQTPCRSTVSQPHPYPLTQQRPAMSEARKVRKKVLQKKMVMAGSKFHHIEMVNQPENQMAGKSWLNLRLLPRQGF